MMPTPELQPSRIFILDDEPDIARLIQASLQPYSFNCDIFHTAHDFLVGVQHETPELCIIDLLLPDMDGMQVVQTLQSTNNYCAVLILTGRNDVSDRVLGLEFGADDYLVKPFEPRELVARVRSILRRYHRTAPQNTAYHQKTRAYFADWCFDRSQHNLCTPGGDDITLSSSEAALLTVLLLHPNRILSREQLLGERDIDPFDRSIDVRISRLRRKLRDDPHEPKLIKTVYGAGYLFAAKVQWS